METVDDVETPFLKLHIDRIGTEMKQRTFDMKIEAYLGAIYLQHLQYKCKWQQLVQTRSVV